MSSVCSVCCVSVVRYEHKTISIEIYCECMVKQNKKIHSLPVYQVTKKHNEWNKENLHHLENCNHFSGEIAEKDEYKYKNECKSYVPLENGENKIEDQCHLKLSSSFTAKYSKTIGKRCKSIGIS